MMPASGIIATLRTWERRWVLTAVMLEDVMAKAQKTTPVRLSEEAIKWVRIASGYTGESAAEYASRVLAERAKQDADQLHAEASKPANKAAKPKKADN